ncbi:MAG: S-adenosylmethionine:tRNA ribosyltransferase-isomerase [Nitrosomonadales bacterium]|nr:S-adenosylmethionine:tRNA ribosyltransferase-isomerase [Nitrosomonadales bacterium]
MRTDKFDFALPEHLIAQHPPERRGASRLLYAHDGALEESAYSFTPQHLLGIYRWRAPESDTTYLRFAFTGAITGHDASRKLDAGILQALWLLPDEIRAMQELHRSPLVLRCIEDYLAGKRYPLDLLVHYE